MEKVKKKQTFWKSFLTIIVGAVILLGLFQLGNLVVSSTTTNNNVHTGYFSNKSQSSTVKINGEIS